MGYKSMTTIYFAPMGHNGVAVPLYAEDGGAPRRLDQRPPPLMDMPAQLFPPLMDMPAQLFSFTFKTSIKQQRLVL